jgi:hypothetical protein
LATGAAVEADFMAEGIIAHVWRRKELESYLLTPSVIARLSGESESAVTSLLAGIRAAMENDVFARLLAEMHSTNVAANMHAVSVTTTYKSEFDLAWSGNDFRIANCPPKMVLSELNRRLQESGRQAVSTSALARAHRVVEIDAEVAETLRAVEAACK